VEISNTVQYINLAGLTIGLVALRGPMHTNGGKIKNSSFFLGVSFLRTTIQKGISMRMLCRQHDSSY
jgi:hypothetical protein